MDRRDFIRTLAGGTCLFSLADLASPLMEDGSRDRRHVSWPCSARAAKHEVLHEASHYNKLEHKEIECVLCPRKCRVGDKERGYCGARENQDGIYYTLVYNRPCSLHTDPIEKKPLFHFFPGSRAFSLATAGCNMNCKYCQNWEISQVRPEQVRSFPLPPGEGAARAREQGALSIAYTYTEPVIFWEYMYDIAVEARKLGIRNVMVSAGYVEEGPLKELLPLMDAVKIDLKAFSDDYYRKICSGKLNPVLESLKTIRKNGTWLEIVYLVLPTLNDSPKEIQALCRWLHDELGPGVPIHFSRFFPTYLMRNLPPTPVGTLERLCETARAEGLDFAYVGNVPGHTLESTYCPDCRTPLVHRTGYSARIEKMKKGKCTHCGRSVPGLWED